MTKIDLVTGFLGAGKTTFIRRYGEWLDSRGVRFAVVENEFGAAGVDKMLLSESLGNVYELSGGCICCTMKSGFFQLLEELCHHCDRVIVEPSGIYNLDDFFEVTDELVRQGLAEPGMCLTLIDPHTLPLLSGDERMVLHDELVGTGAVLWTKTDLPPSCDPEASREAVSALVPDAALCFYDKPAHVLRAGDYEQLQSKTAVRYAHERAFRVHQNMYQSSSLFFATERFDRDRLYEALDKLTSTHDAGDILRIKGFVNGREGGFTVNCTVGTCLIERSSPRTAMLNIIGHNLKRKLIRDILSEAASFK